jgi:hypothetical protein
MRKKIIGIFVCMLLIITCVVPVMGELTALKKSSNDINLLHSSNTILNPMSEKSPNFSLGDESRHLFFKI